MLVYQRVPLWIMDFWGDLLGSGSPSLGMQISTICRNLQPGGGEGNKQKKHTHIYICVYIYMYMYIYIYVYIYVCVGMVGEKKTTPHLSGYVWIGIPFLVGRSSRTV